MSITKQRKSQSKSDPHSTSWLLINMKQYERREWEKTTLQLTAAERHIATSFWDFIKILAWV